jgi:hypothetical protein
MRARRDCSLAIWRARLARIRASETRFIARSRYMRAKRDLLLEVSGTLCFVLCRASRCLIAGCRGKIGEGSWLFAVALRSLLVLIGSFSSCLFDFMSKGL